MSRSFWALAETRRRGRLVRAAGERRRFDGRSRLGPRLLPGAVSAAQWAAVLAAAGMLVMAAEPAGALAASGGTAQARPQANQTPDQVVLAPGSGYAGGKDAALVRSLQRRLDGQGYSPGPVDGRYGPRTEIAVERFQTARDLRVDGIAGPLTLRALHTTVLYPGTGDAGAASSKVRGLQRQLRRDGFNPGPIDGRYGPLTEAAVRDFQAVHGLRVDGIAGAQTLGELRRITAAERPVTRPAPRERRTSPSHPRPLPKRTTKPSHPVTPRATKPGGAGFPVALVLAGALALAALGSGVWLIDRRRRKPAIVPVPVPEPEPGPALADGYPEPPFEDPAAAELVFREADERGDPGAASNLGVLLEQRGDTSGAEAAYRRADARGSADGAFNLAGLLFELGDVQGAISAYRRADERGDATAASNLARLLADRGDAAGAEDAFRRAEQRGDASAASNLGVLLERRGDVHGAEAAYRRGDARGDPDGALNLGEMLEKRGDLEGAADAYARADQNGDQTASARLGMLLERQHDYSAAIEAYARAELSDRREIVELARSRAQALAFGLSLSEKGPR
jgi:peptidoglycan hydrolase-like protein with peptidoglycan-binding domain/tetratricopeptide (TPR) repeat protein